MIKHVIFFPNGNTAVFDEAGQQIPDYQHPWHLQFLKDLPVDLREITIVMPDMSAVEFFKTDEGRWNWNILQ